MIYISTKIYYDKKFKEITQTYSNIDDEEYTWLIVPRNLGFLYDKTLDNNYMCATKLTKAEYLQLKPYPDIQKKYKHVAMSMSNKNYHLKTSLDRGLKKISKIIGLTRLLNIAKGFTKETRPLSLQENLQEQFLSQENSSQLLPLRPP